MKMLFILLTFLLSFSSQAKDFKLDKDTFLKKINEGRISLNKTAVMQIPESMRPQLIAAQKKQFPDFQEAMWFAAYIDSDNYRYFVFYEWYNRGCIYGVTQPSKYTKGADQSNSANAVSEMKSYSKIDEIYCERALGISLKKGGLKGTDLYKFKGESK